MQPNVLKMEYSSLSILRMPYITLNDKWLHTSLCFIFITRPCSKLHSPQFRAVSCGCIIQTHSDRDGCVKAAVVGLYPQGDDYFWKPSFISASLCAACSDQFSPYDVTTGSPSRVVVFTAYR